MARASAVLSFRRIHIPFVATTFVAAVILTTACNAPAKRVVQPDSAKAQPIDDLEAATPQWAYDAPQYAKPSSEPDPQLRSDPREPLHFFLNRRMLQIRRPAPRTSDESPRVAIAMTTDQGATWKRTGFFGRGQTFFPLEVPQDGDFGFAFVTAAAEAPRAIERIYHVDTTQPEIALTIEPSTTTLTPGQSVTLTWKASDRFLLDRPVQISLTGPGGQNRVLAPEQTAEGSFSFTLPDAPDQPTLEFRIEALDRAGNVGLASRAIKVLSDAPSRMTAVVETATTVEVAAVTPHETTTPSATVPYEPADPCELDCPAGFVVAGLLNGELPAVAVSTSGDEVMDRGEPSKPADTIVAKMPAGPSMQSVPVNQFEAPHPERVALVPQLPAFTSESDIVADCPWQTLHGTDPVPQTVVWAMPKPRFLSEVARYIDAQWRDATVGGVAVAPLAVEFDPAVARAGTGIEPPSDGPMTP